MATKFSMSPKLTRKNSKIRASICNAMGMPTEISKEELGRLECHFNWDVCNLTESTLQERIDAVEGHIRENAANILPQSYCLLAYLKSICQNAEVHNEVHQDLLEAQHVLDSMNTAATHTNEVDSWRFGLGYKAVILGNLTVWLSKINKHQDAEKHYQEYQDIKRQYDLQNHPEVLAMKAFALGYSNDDNRFQKTVEAYEKALSHRYYKNRVEWLFGLALSKNLVSNKMDVQVKEDLFEIESILRRVIKLDQSHSLAMLRLAKTLIKTSGSQTFEEIEYWIDKALKTDRKISIIEEAGQIYFMTARDKPKDIDKAIALFQESEKMNEYSKNTLVGLGRSYFQKYFNNKSKIKTNRGKNKNRKKDNNQIPEDLWMAKKYFERIKNKRQDENFRLAHIYQEMSQFAENEEYTSHAEQIFKEEIKNAEEETNAFKKVSAYSKYAIFLRKNCKVENEITYLKKAVEVPFEGDAENSETRFVRECQEKLLVYASDTSNKKLMSQTEALLLKGFIQMKRSNIHSAIFYYKRAIEIDGGKNPRPKEQLVDWLLEASRTAYPSHVDDLQQEYLEEAQMLLHELEESERKCDLRFKIKSFEINAEMGQIEKLEKLMERQIKLEELHRDRQKDSLTKNVTFSDMDNEECDHVLQILGESKRTLDRSMNIVKVEIYGKPHNEPPYCYYPCPKNLSIPYTSQVVDKAFIEDRMKSLLVQRYKLHDFNINHKELFDFLVSKQPIDDTSEYNWLQKIIDVRNNEEHFIDSIELLMSTFPDREERISVAREVSFYAAQVWKRFDQEVKNQMSTV